MSMSLKEPKNGVNRMHPLVSVLYPKVWRKVQGLHPLIEDLIYWRNVSQSALVFNTGLLVIMAMSCFSVISVLAWLSLLTLAATFTYRIYRLIVHTLNDSLDDHPFGRLLEVDLSISPEYAENVVSLAVGYINCIASQLRSLFLVENFLESIKFAAILWILTYIGAWFNGITLVFLAYITLFTFPKMCECNQAFIENILDWGLKKVSGITDKVGDDIAIDKMEPVTECIDKED